MGIRRGFPVRTRSPRRSVSWVDGPEATELAFSATGTQIWTSGVVTTLGEITVVRIRGRFNAFVTAATSAGDGFDGAVGIGIVTSQAFGSGIGAVPTPLTELEWDGWMWHNFFNVRMITGTASDGVNAVSAVFDVEIDTKAMRKFGDTMTLFGIVEVTEQGAAAMECWGNCRMLVKHG